MKQKTLKKLAAALASAAAVAAAIGAVTALGSSASPDPLFARVSMNGTLRAGSPGVTVANVGAGQYEVPSPSM